MSKSHCRRPKTIECVEDSLQTALEKAEAQLPIFAHIIEKKLSASSHRVIKVKGAGEEDAREQAKLAKRKTERIEDITLQKKGKKGFLRFSKKLNSYKVRLFEPAVVRIKYERIGHEITNKEEIPAIDSSLLKEVLREQSAFVRVNKEVLREQSAFVRVNKEVLRDESAFVRENAALDIAEAVKLGHLSQAEACTYLCPLLEKDPDDSVREFTVGAMWHVIGDKRARKSICKAIISDSSRIVRLLGLSCLNSYHNVGGRDKETLECMIRAGHNDENLRVRRFAQSCLKMYLILCLDQLSLAEKEQIESACQDLPCGFRESMDSEILMLMNALYAGSTSDGRITTESTLPLERVREKRESLKDAVLALIEGLQMDICKSALEVLQIVTGQDFGENQTQWREWWEQNKH